MLIQKLTVQNQPVINILLAGVGGQGVLVASDIIIELAMQANFDVKKSEVHGMAQRGGSVVSQVRYGEKIYSPLIKKGDSDIIFAFEKLEAVRYLDFLKTDGYVIYNNQQITPLTVFTMNIEYPKNIDDLCRKKTNNIVMVDAISIMNNLGNLKVLNTIMLGVLSNLLEFETEAWLKIITSRVPSKTIEINKHAFVQGRALIMA
jgi:indolepyruvate ferredoxin oxidoreductase, beta subunit